MEPFIVNGNQDFLSLLNYRVNCKLGNQPGLVIENGVSFHVDSNGRYQDNRFPEIEDHLDNLLMELVGW